MAACDVDLHARMTHFLLSISVEYVPIDTDGRVAFYFSDGLNIDE